MKIIDIETLKEIKFSTIIFSDGQVNPKIDSDSFDSTTYIDENNFNKVSPPYRIIAKIRSSNDFMELLMTTDALKRMGAEKIELRINYFPAARQDRPMVRGEALGVKVIADLINLQNYSKVFILDPHSSVTPALINNVVINDNVEFVKQALISFVKRYSPKRIYLVIPDAGAEKKVYKCYEAIIKSLPDIAELIVCEILGRKIRDVSNGKILRTSIDIDTIIPDSDCIIIDDICDRGGTFIELSKVLKAKGASRIHLFVTHGIFPAGFEELGKHLESIYCTDSYREITFEEYNNFIHLEQILNLL